ncbi:hypothetical protein BP5796_11832 [Coleophoma crateriformis]|uniref:MMS19 nucleotide excision repair protein n=1 Tax=Coleophoma crateriformis TaxID=565419 RepID=A0A3D8QEF6_9HELO|nr:hypothetical protein BP5796_11832 [Coleophoma crateriformis]
METMESSTSVAEQKNDFPDRTVSEYVELSSNATQNEDELSKITIDITGRIELGTEGKQTFSLFLRELAPFISPGASLVDSAIVSAVTTLLCARIRFAEEENYRANIKDAASALLSLSLMKNFLKSDAVIILDDFFRLSTSLWTQQIVATRLAVYELLQNLLTNHREELLKQDRIGHKLAEGFTGLAVPEKDATCLRHVFPIYVSLSKDRQAWGINDEDLEMIWDSFIRYYPIKIAAFGRKNADLSKPDPLILRELLLQCFISTSGYAQWSFPRLIDLLDVQSDVSADFKNDALKTLAACVKAYDQSTIDTWAPKLWDSLKFEVLNGENDDFISGAILVIRELTQKSTIAISESAWTNDTPLPPFIINLAAEMSQRLVEPAQRYTPQCAKILSAVASVNPFTFHAIVRLILARLITVYQSLDTTAKKDNMVRLFNDLIKACSISLQGHDLVNGSHKQALKTLRALQSPLVEIYFEAMSQPVTSDADEIKLRMTTMKGLSGLFEIPDYITTKQGVLVEGLPVFEVSSFLSEYEKGTIVDSLSKVVLVALPSNAEIYVQAIAALRTTAIHDPRMFAKITLENFLEALPKSVASKAETEDIVHKLESLARIACGDLVVVSPAYEDSVSQNPTKCQLFFSFSNALLQKLESVIQHKSQGRYAFVIVAALYRGLLLFDAALDQHSTQGTNEVQDEGLERPNGVYGDFIIRLYRLCTQRKDNKTLNSTYIGLRHLPCGGEIFDDKFLTLVGKYAVAGLRSKHVPASASPLNWYSQKSSAGLNQDKSSKGEKPHDVWALFDQHIKYDEENFEQYNCVSGPTDKCSANILSMSLLAGSPKEVDHRLNITQAAAYMVRNAISKSNGASIDARMSFIYTLQLLVNKFGVLKIPTDSESSLVEVLRKHVQDAATYGDADAFRVYQTLAYVASAALLAFDPSHSMLIEMMIQNLQLPSRSIKVAQSFKILLAPSEVIAEKNACFVRPLAKGRLYALVIPYLITEYSKKENAVFRQSYLIALAAVLSYMPLQLIKADAPRLLPLLLAGTDVNNAGDDDQTKMDCITVLNNLIPEVPEVVEEHVDSIINRMVERVHNTMAEPSDASPPCRKMALECIRLLAVHSRPVVALKRKPRIMRELEVASNDVSRTVRAAADRARIFWFNVTDDEVKEDE